MAWACSPHISLPLRQPQSQLQLGLQVERGSMWCFEQEQSLGGSNVSTNVRMTAIKLRSGGLFVHAPIAATKSATCSSLPSCLQSGSTAE